MSTISLPRKKMKEKVATGAKGLWKASSERNRIPRQEKEVKLS